MATEHVPWTDGTWTNPPRQTHPTADGSLTVAASEHSDYWQRTVYGFQHNDGHALLASWPADRAVEVSFDASCLTALYDQAGLMLWYDDQRWIKAGVEISDGVPHVGAVVTDGWSDWSLFPVSDWGTAEVTIRASRMRDGVVIRARTAASGWRTIRVARFDHGPEVKAGPCTCAPTSADLAVRFTRWSWADPDRDLHADPPVD